MTIATLTPADTAEKFLGKLKTEFLRQRPATLDIQDAEVTVRGGLSTPSWNLLAPISLATIRAVTGAHKVVVVYEIRFTTIIRVCAFLSAVSLLVAAAYFKISIDGGLSSRDQMISLVGFAVSTQIAIWGWLYGANYVLTGLRIRRMLRTIANSLPPPPQEGFAD